MVNLDDVRRVRADGVEFRPWEGSSTDLPRSVRRYAKNADERYYPAGYEPGGEGMTPHRDMRGPAGEQRLRRALRDRNWGRYQRGEGAPRRLRQFSELADTAVIFGMGAAERSASSVNHFWGTKDEKERQDFIAPIAALAGRALGGSMARSGGGRLAQGAANLAGQGAANKAMDSVGFSRDAQPSMDPAASLPPEVLNELLARRQIAPSGSTQAFGRNPRQRKAPGPRRLDPVARWSRGLAGKRVREQLDDGFNPTVIGGSQTGGETEGYVKTRAMRRAAADPNEVYNVDRMGLTPDKPVSDEFVPVRINKSGQQFDRLNEQRTSSQRENIFDDPVKEAEQRRQTAIGSAESRQRRESHRREMDELYGARNRRADREIEQYRRRQVTPATPERKQAERGALRDDVTRRRRQMVDRDRVNRSLRGGLSGRRGRLGVPDSAMESPDLNQRTEQRVRPGLDSLGARNRGSWDAPQRAGSRASSDRARRPLELQPEPMRLLGAGGPGSSSARARSILAQIERNRMDREPSGSGQPRRSSEAVNLQPGEYQLGRDLPRQRGVRGATVYGNRLGGMQGGTAGYRPGMRRLLGLQGIGVGRDGGLRGIRGGRAMGRRTRQRLFNPQRRNRFVRRFEQDDQDFGVSVANTMPGRAMRALSGVIDNINPRRTVETLRGKGYGPRTSAAIGWGSHIADATVIPSFGLPVTSAAARRLPRIKRRIA